MYFENKFGANEWQTLKWQILILVLRGLRFTCSCVPPSHSNFLRDAISCVVKQMIWADGNVNIPMTSLTPLNEWNTFRWQLFILVLWDLRFMWSWVPSLRWNFMHDAIACVVEQMIWAAGYVFLITSLAPLNEWNIFRWQLFILVLKGKLGKKNLSAQSFYLTLTKRSFKRQF